jgi:hypothetical protein
MMVRNRTEDDQRGHRDSKLFGCICRHNLDERLAELSGGVPELTNRRAVCSLPRIGAPVPEGGEANEQARCSVNKHQNCSLKVAERPAIRSQKLTLTMKNRNTA